MSEPRYATAKTPERKTLGGSLAKVAKKIGVELMPWQRHVGDVALEVSDDGSLVYGTVVLTIPRQQGKSTLLLAVRVHRAVHPHWAGPQSILWTAQSRVSARTKWADEQIPILKRSVLRGLFEVRRSTGQEAILWRNGSRDMIVASLEASGHGEVLDLGVIDEAWSQSDSRLEQAFIPAMLTRPSPQLWVVSTAGDLDSKYLREKVERGREAVAQGVNEGLCYFEWSAPEDADLGDPKTWESCMPALGRTVTHERVGRDFAAMPLAEFRRSHLNLWADVRSEPVFDLDRWKEAAA